MIAHHCRLWSSASLILGLLAPAGICQPSAAVPPALKHRGVCYVSWLDRHVLLSEGSDARIDSLPVLGATWVSLRVTWQQTKFDVPSLYPCYFTPSDDALGHAVRRLHARNLKVMVTLVVDLADETGSDWRPGGGKWRGRIEFPTDELWDQWFEAYERFALHYARLCQELHVDLLCLGVELTLCSTSQEGRWRDLIAKARAVYRGLLTYQANWSPVTYDRSPAALIKAKQWQSEYRQVGFWDALDYAAVCTYFPLVADPRPSQQQLEAGWKLWLGDLRDWQTSHGRPVLLNEMGYHSCDGAAVRPWEHRMTGNVNFALQRDCYEAFMKTFWDEPWVAGVYWWFVGHPEESGVDENRTGFPFLGKPAEEVVRRWFTRSGNTAEVPVARAR